MTSRAIHAGNSARNARAGIATRLPFLVVLALGLAACSTTPESDFYLIGTRPVENIQAPDSVPLRLGVGPIRLPGYLRGVEIVTRTVEGRILYDPFARWAEPLDTRFAAVLAENLSGSGAVDVLVYPWVGGAIDLQLVVDVVAFEVVEDGRFVLTARWVLFDQAQRRELHRARFTASQPVEPSNYAARTAAGTELLASFAEDIAEIGRRLAREAVLEGDGDQP